LAWLRAASQKTDWGPRVEDPLIVLHSSRGFQRCWAPPKGYQSLFGEIRPKTGLWQTLTVTFLGLKKRPRRRQETSSHEQILRTNAANHFLHASFPFRAANFYAATHAPAALNTSNRVDPRSKGMAELASLKNGRLFSPIKKKTLQPEWLSQSEETCVPE